jgi:hypothetical protein
MTINAVFVPTACATEKLRQDRSRASEKADITRPPGSDGIWDLVQRGTGEGKDARPERFELPTLWFEAKCSIQLSYGRARERRSS